MVADGTALRSLDPPRRVTAKCDPYGQEGRPLALSAILPLLPLHPGWRCVQSLPMYCNPRERISGAFVNVAVEVATVVGDGHGHRETLARDGKQHTGDAMVLHKVWPCSDYANAIALSNRIAKVAQGEGHYPLHLGVVATAPDNVVVVAILGTPALRGLSYTDFYLSVLIDATVPAAAST